MLGILSTSRESEIQLSTKDQSRVFRLEDNSLKVGSDQPKDIASFDSPIKLQWCLQRRPRKAKCRKTP